MEKYLLVVAFTYGKSADHSRRTSKVLSSTGTSQHPHSEVLRGLEAPATNLFVPVLSPSPSVFCLINLPVPFFKPKLKIFYTVFI